MICDDDDDDFVIGVAGSSPEAVVVASRRSLLAFYLPLPTGSPLSFSLSFLLILKPRPSCT